MDYIDNMHKTLDKIMHMQHNIMTSIINMAEDEIKRRPQSAISEGLLKKEFEDLGKQYVELRKRMNTYKVQEYKGKKSLFEGTTIVVDEEEAKKDDNLILDVRDDAKSYVREAYETMQFIPNDEAGLPSIYDGDKAEGLRELEYEMYEYNLLAIESKGDLEGIDISLMPYRCSAIIIEDMAQRKAFQNSYSKISKIIEDVENPEKYPYLSKGQREKIREELIYMKYEEKFKILNQEHNGILTKDMPISRAIESAQKLDAVYLMLNLSEEDFDRFYKPMVLEYLADIKEDVKNIFREYRPTKKAEKDSVSKVKKVVEKAKKIKDSLAENRTRLLKSKSKKNVKPEVPDDR